MSVTTKQEGAFRVGFDDTQPINQTDSRSLRASCLCQAHNINVTISLVVQLYVRTPSPRFCGWVGPHRSLNLSLMRGTECVYQTISPQVRVSVGSYRIRAESTIPPSEFDDI